MQREETVQWNNPTQEDIRAAEEYAKERFRKASNIIISDMAFLAGILHEREKNKKIVDKLNEAFLPQNIECDGSYCPGCWKDVVREAIKMIAI